MIECETHSRPGDWYGRPRSNEPTSWRTRKRQLAEAVVVRYGYRLDLSGARKRNDRRALQFAVTDLSVELRFRALAREWKTEARLASTPTQMFLLPSYQRIIGLGPKVIPAILRDLLREPNHWFWALAALSGENPVNTKDIGNVRAMTQSWLQWGKQQGYL